MGRQLRTSIPSSLLVRAIERWAAERSVSLNEACRVLGPKVGLSWQDAARNLTRWRTGKTRSVFPHTADKWCTAMGTHLTVLADTEWLDA